MVPNLVVGTAQANYDILTDSYRFYDGTRVSAEMFYDQQSSAINAAQAQTNGAGMMNVSFGCATIRPESVGMLAIGAMWVSADAAPSVRTNPETRAPWVYRLSAPVWMTRKQRRLAALSLLTWFALLLAVAEMMARG